MAYIYRNRQFSLICYWCSSLFALNSAYLYIYAFCLCILTIVVLSTSKSNLNLIISNSFLTESVLSSSIILIINSKYPFSIFHGDLFGLRLWLSLKIVVSLIMLKDIVDFAFRPWKFSWVIHFKRIFIF